MCQCVGGGWRGRGQEFRSYTGVICKHPLLELKITVLTYVEKFRKKAVRYSEVINLFISCKFTLISLSQYHIILLQISGSDRALTINNKSILGRQTKWGFVEVENPNHCEFSLLRDMLLR